MDNLYSQKQVTIFDQNDWKWKWFPQQITEGLVNLW